MVLFFSSSSKLSFCPWTSDFINTFFINKFELVLNVILNIFQIATIFQVLCSYVILCTMCSAMLQLYVPSCLWKKQVLSFFVSPRPPVLSMFGLTYLAIICKLKENLTMILASYLYIVNVQIYFCTDLKLEHLQLVKSLVWEQQLIIYPTLACKGFINMKLVHIYNYFFLCYV